MTSAHVGDAVLALRVLVGFALAYLLGFERELRGSAAGTRTFALVGATSSCVAAVTSSTPQALAGILTGVGFIGGGVILHNQGNAGSHESGGGAETGVVGITTAATIFAAAGDGLVIGIGHLALGLLITALVLLVLEIPYLPVLNVLDARRYAQRFRPDRGAGPGQPHP